ncbi:MAG: glycosyltransferase family 4 protein, partial [Vicinamibacteria bacterium]|nr:glycosyltransferase family 4 protein [Vicinamibacteria bacterium]
MRVVAIGSGRSVHALSRSAAVAATGIEVRFVTVGPVLPIAGLEVRTRPLPTNPIAAVRAALGFLRDVRAFAPDLVHLHYAGGKLASLATSAHAHPLVATVMGGDVLPEQHQGGLSFWERRATRRVLQEADLLLAKSDALQAAIRSFAPTKARIETVRWGVDPARTQRDETGAAVWRARLGLAPDTPVILSPRTPHALYN